MGGGRVRREIRRYAGKIVPAEHDLLLGNETIASLQVGIFDVAGKTETGDTPAGVARRHRADRRRSGGADESGKLAQPFAQ
jgi:hypothetical protein